jgi:hypothetical protein
MESSVYAAWSPLPMKALDADYALVLSMLPVPVPQSGDPLASWVKCYFGTLTENQALDTFVGEGTYENPGRRRLGYVSKVVADLA